MLEASEIPETMPDLDDNDEGCLSVPGEQFPTGRADWPASPEPTATARGGHRGQRLLARMLQHETGHSTVSCTSTSSSAATPVRKKAVKRNGWAPRPHLAAPPRGPLRPR